MPESHSLNTPKGYPRYLGYLTTESHSSNIPRRTIRNIEKGVKNHHNLLKININHIWMNVHLDDEIRLLNYEVRDNSMDI